MTDIARSAPPNLGWAGSPASGPADFVAVVLQRVLPSGCVAVDPVRELVAHEAYLPRRVGDVLRDVDDRPVRPDEHLVVPELLVLDHPAPRVLPFRLEHGYPLVLQLLEDLLPHPGPEYVGLPVQEVVARSQSPARLKLRGEDLRHYLLRVLADLAAPLLYLLQHQPLLLLERRVSLVDLVDLRVYDVSAVRVELHAVGRLVGEVKEPQPDYDVGHLRAGVVDVVEGLDFVPEPLHRPDERVAQDEVPRVPYVKRLVGVDVGVLDRDRASSRPGASSCRTPPSGLSIDVEELVDEEAPVRPEVHVARVVGLDAADEAPSCALESIVSASSFAIIPGRLSGSP